MRNIFSLSCKRAAQLFIDSQERKLKPGEIAALLAHRFVCGLCRRFWNQIFFVEKVTRQYTHKLEIQDFPVEAALSTQSKDRIKQSLGS